MRLKSTALLLALLPLMGCPPTDKEGEDTAPEDTDTPGEEVERTPYSFAGSVTVSSSFDGVVECDAAADLTGENYTGDCDDCDFAVAIESTITTDNSTSDCGYYPYYSFIEAGSYYDLFLAHAEEYSGYYYDYTDAFMSGWSYSYEYYGNTYDYPGPYITTISYDGSSYGTFSRTGNDIAWTLETSGTYNDYPSAYYDDCGSYAEFSYSETSATATETGTGDVDCDGYIADVWTFEADGSAVVVSVDTTIGATAFDPVLWVSGPDECTIAYADDNYTCSYPPPKYECPTAELDTTEAGTYTVVVVSSGYSCTDTTKGDYSVSVEGGTGLTQIQDDIDSYTTVEHSYDIEISGSGTLTAE